MSRTPYCHELGLRSLLHAINSSALRYKKAITPLVSCSIDFYIRVFVRVDYSPLQAKLGASKTSMVYHCAGCTSFHTQPLGAIVQREKSVKYKTNQLPVDGRVCDQCDTPYNIAGPVYGAAIHDGEFVGRMLEHVKQQQEQATKYGTTERMIGMLTVIKEELDVPFYYSVGSVSGVIKCVTPKLSTFMYVRDSLSNTPEHAGQPS